MTGFAWRPRPSGVLNKKELLALKADYRKKYGKAYKEEERKDSTKHNEEVRAKRMAVTEEFLTTFFLPLRRKYDADVEWYKANFSIKESDLEAQPVTIQHVFAYGDQINVRVLE